MPLYDLFSLAALLAIIFLTCYSGFLIFVKKEPIDDKDKVTIAVMGVVALWLQLLAIFRTFV